MSESPEQTSKRKADHLKICLNDDVNYKEKTTGFEYYDFVHYCITEVDYNKIDLSTEIFGKKLNYPFLISSMTGGAKEAENINRQLAEIANKLNIAMGVGSQRQALSDDSYLKSYRIIREKAPDIPLFANIGAYQIAKTEKPEHLSERLVEMINADALIIHVNPLQELVQEEGETDFSGLLKNIKRITRKTAIPVIVKEVGAGISKKAAKKLLDVGVKAIDVAGAGGTSWSAVEMKRNNEMHDYFRDWGIPTAEALRDVNKLRKKYDFVLISSGGINDGVKIAKSIAMGANLAAAAGVVLKILFEQGEEALRNNIVNWFDEVKKIMYLTGCSNIKELMNTKLQRRKF